MTKSTLDFVTPHHYAHSMTHPCMLCGLPARISTPTGWCCDSCRLEADELDKLDFPIANAPCCPDCGGIVERNEFCGWCDAQQIRRDNEWKLAHA